MPTSPHDCPFPGMDPYLEGSGLWPEFHSHMLTVIHTSLLDHLPRGYDAVMEKNSKLVDITSQGGGGEATVQRRRPDVAVTRVGGGRGRSVEARPWDLEPEGGVAVLEPPAATLDPVEVRVRRVVEERIERWIEVRRGADRELVTVIELLSPANKVGSGYAGYQAKRHGLIDAGIHLLELDLLLDGGRVEEEAVLPPADYMAVLTRVGRAEMREVYAWSIRHSLPTVPVPLRSPDADVGLDLAEAFAEAYRRGRYRRRLAYGDALLPERLSHADAAWTRETITPLTHATV